jgi:hypothetical protein
LLYTGEHEDAQKLFETIVKAKGSSITDLRRYPLFQLKKFLHSEMLFIFSFFVVFSLSQNLKLALVHSKPADTPTNPTTASSTQPARPTVQPTAQPTVQPTVAATLKSEPVQTAPKTNSVVENTKTEVKSVDGDEETEDDDSENIAALKRLRDKLQRKKQGASGTQTEQKVQF